MNNFSTFLALQRERISSNKTLVQDIRKARFAKAAEPLPTEDRDSTGRTYHIPSPDSIKSGYAMNKILYV